MINVFQPSLGEEELARIQEVFTSNWLGKGRLTEEFETGFAVHLGVPRQGVLSTNCCSEGLFASMHLFGIGPGDEVILPTVSFVGAGNAVCASGAKLVLCDVDPRTLNLTAQDLEEKITPRTKAVMPLHYGGVPCDMDAILETARKHGLAVIEDSACSVASTYKGRACGTLGGYGYVVLRRHEDSGLRRRGHAVLPGPGPAGAGGEMAVFRLGEQERIF